MDWRKTRHIVLTIDRSKYAWNYEAYDDVTEHKKIAGLVRNLRRTAALGVIDWIWVMEFHSDGFPHWHLFLERDKSGRASMVGGDLLRKYWSGLVFESYIESKEHWQNLTGYFEKHSYFSDEKGHQNTLPDWARARESRIRRFGAMAFPRVDMEKQIEIRVKDQGEKVVRKMRNYAVILEECGKSTFVEVTGDFEGWGFGIRRKVEEEYSKIRKNGGGEYIPKVGYVMEFDYIELCEFLRQSPGLHGVLCEVEEKYLKNEFHMEWGEASE